MTDIYQTDTRAWEEVEKWAKDNQIITPVFKCFLELRSRIEYLEKTLKEIAYDQLIQISQELQGNEYKTTEPEPKYPSNINNLYIINEVLINNEAARYSSGMAVIAAPSLERCREIFEAEFKGGMNEFDAAVKYNTFKVIEAVNYAEGVISYVYGGG